MTTKEPSKDMLKAVAYYDVLTRFLALEYQACLRMAYAKVRFERISITFETIGILVTITLSTLDQSPWLWLGGMSAGLYLYSIRTAHVDRTLDRMRNMGTFPMLSLDEYIQIITKLDADMEAAFERSKEADTKRPYG